MKPYVISLSSIPPRFDKLQATLKRLLRQRPRPQRILLWIPYEYRRFPDWDGTLPDVPDGVEIVRTEFDYGPATKVLPATKMYAGTDMDILFCDDDIRYPRGWAHGFLRTRKRQPDAALCICCGQVSDDAGNQGPRKFGPPPVRLWRTTDIEFQIKLLYHSILWNIFGRKRLVLGRRVHLVGGFVDYFEGYGGVMVKADSFPPEAYDIPAVFWAVDDYWLSGMLTQGGVPIYAVPCAIEPTTQEYFTEAALFKAVIDGKDREEANQAVVQYMQDAYGIWS